MSDDLLSDAPEPHFGRRSVLWASVAAAAGIAGARILLDPTAATAAIAYNYPTSPYSPGMRPDQLFRAPRENGRLHDGRDINYTSQNQAIFSVADGVVVSRNANSTSDGYGFWTEIRNDDGVRFRYAHFKALSNFGAGARVARGQQIGTMGGSGFGRTNYYGVHLHLECRPSLSSNNTVDPVPFLQSRVNGIPASPPPQRRGKTMYLKYNTGGGGYLVTEKGIAGLTSQQFNLFNRLIGSDQSIGAVAASTDPFLQSEFEIMNAVLRSI